jgi:tritrans,polycis-undecaprenyl-diphosphate synthase [geranylgeranyl-diphosphate specific]
MPTTLVVPDHIGFILDGNRRFARIKGLRPWRGHEYGKDKVHEILDWCEEFGVRELTLYTFSMQNFKRPAREVDKLMQLIQTSFDELATDKRVHSRHIRVRAIGQLDLLPKDVQASIEAAEKATAHYKKFTLNICVAYGGKEEIFEAVKQIVRQVKRKMIDVADLTLEKFESHLFLKSEPDLIIRTGGECRTSNFLSWQSGYSEWFFVDKLLPEFEREDLADIIKEFGERERRFGK